MVTWEGNLVEGQDATLHGGVVINNIRYHVHDTVIKQDNICVEKLRTLEINSGTVSRISYRIIRCVNSQLKCERHEKCYRVPAIRFSITTQTNTKCESDSGTPVHLCWKGDSVILDPDHACPVSLDSCNHNHAPNNLCCEFLWVLTIQKGNKSFQFFRRDSHCLFDNWRYLHNNSEFICPCDTCMHRDHYERIPLELTIE